MIDSLVRLLPATDRLPTNGYSERYALVTLHRPSNVDDAANLRRIVQSLLELTDFLEVVFPVHLRTRARLSEFAVDLSRLHITEPLPYIEFRTLQRRACMVITDSGGIQEETTLLQGALHYDSREHRASDYCQHGKQYVGWLRHGFDEE
jgi:UDP-N-acetylglucosamine 2-epimerase (non-hydrolysing)